MHASLPSFVPPMPEPDLPNNSLQRLRKNRVRGCTDRGYFAALPVRIFSREKKNTQWGETGKGIPRDCASSSATCYQSIGEHHTPSFCFRAGLPLKPAYYRGATPSFVCCLSNRLIIIVRGGPAVHPVIQTERTQPATAPLLWV
jgi:hypothetical protein